MQALYTIQEIAVLLIQISVFLIAFETMSASGKPITKQNQSIKDLVAVNKQMLMILDKMKLTVDEPTGEETEEDDL